MAISIIVGLTLCVCFMIGFTIHQVSRMCTEPPSKLIDIDNNPRGYQHILMTVEEAEKVTTDPSIETPEALASALHWARKQNAVLYRGIQERIIEMARLRTANQTIASHGSIDKVTTRPFECTRLVAADAHYEKDTERLDNVALPNISLKFAFEYCEDKKIVRLIKHLNCDESSRFTDDSAYDEYVRHNIGPDDIALALEGPEIHDLVSPLRYLGGCTYEASISVGVSGKYRLNLVWWRENYGSAVDLPQNGWMPAHADIPLGHSTTIDLVAEQSDQAGKSIMKCDLRDPEYGYLEGMWHTNNEGVPIVNGNRYTWQAKGCQLKIFNSSEAAQCLAGKKVLFEGDSHMRQLRSSLVLLACNVEVSVHTCGCTTQCPGLEGLCVIADGLADSPSFMLDDNVDLNIANFGQHWIDGERRRSVASYKTYLDALVERLRLHNRSASRRVAWYQSNAMFMRKDAWIQGYSDQRTNVKLRVMNEHANARMRALGIPIIPSFAQTMAIITHNEDVAHIDLPILGQSAAQFVLGLLCPYDD